MSKQYLNNWVIKVSKNNCFIEQICIHIPAHTYAHKQRHMHSRYICLYTHELHCLLPPYVTAVPQNPSPMVLSLPKLLS